MEGWDPGLVFRIADVAGVVGNGLLGGAVARAKRFDLIGFLFLAIVSGLGGGIIRDVMLGARPVALTDPFYLGGAVAAAVIAYVLTLDGPISRRALSLVDVVALGCWSATGASKALAAGLGWIPAILLGVITAVGGGMLRDVLVNETPAIFGGKPLYATIGVVAALEMVALQHYGRPTLGMGVAILTATTLGLVARWRNWQLPGPADVTFRSARLLRQRRRDYEDPDEAPCDGPDFGS
ncbi:hypothetical protein GCM10028820_09720 [Tessaracoccus terricola]